MDGRLGPHEMLEKRGLLMYRLPLALVEGHTPLLYLPATCSRAQIDAGRALMETLRAEILAGRVTTIAQALERVALPDGMTLHWVDMRASDPLVFE